MAAPERGIPEWWRLPSLGLLLCLATGCASVPMDGDRGRAYDFDRDSFAFANEIAWKYPQLASAGAETPAVAVEADYRLHCFAVTRANRKFFLHARFDAALPRVSDEAYRGIIEQVLARSPRGDLPDSEPVVIPGYAGLREFSQDKESLLKAQMGGVLDSFFQMGNWRMVFPFSRSHQRRVEGQVLKMIRAQRPAIVHVVRFPRVTINHAVILYGARETPAAVEFTVYDPNDTAKPLILTYDRATETFIFPHTAYFAGGPVNVYEVYRRGLF